MPGTDQKPSPAFSVMDARKFLRAINTSAQAKVIFFEESVSKMGKQVGKNYRLTALDANSLIFEDVDANQYYVADIAKKLRGKIEIGNIMPVKIVDEQKSESFEKHCTDLVESVATDNFRDAEKAFRVIEVQRFRPSVIPESGWVTTRDGNAHRIVIESEENLSCNIPAITEAFCEAVSEFVELDDTGKIIRGVFPEANIKFAIPINEMTRRRLVARHMKSIAENAWRSDTFRKLAVNTAGMVSKGEIKEAITLTAKFLKENQEFSMLTGEEIRVLVENALAARGQFNSILAEDVSTLMHRTNAKINRDEICEAWEKTALKAENSELLHSIKLLESSEDFIADYDNFIGSVFNEGMDVQAARAKAYLTTLKVINSILTKMEGKEELAGQVDNMIAELEEPEPSTDVVMEAEQLLCSIPDTLVDRIVTLENFTEMPGMEEPADTGAPSESSGPAVSLPSGPEEDEEGGMEEEPEEGLEEEELPLPESREKKEGTVIEEMTVAQLQGELDTWKLDGHIFLKEDGFDDCNSQFAKYIKRCEVLDSTGLREGFESLRKIMIETGDDVVEDETIIEDPYAGIDVGGDIEINEEYGAKMGSPTGSGVAAKSGSEPGHAGKGGAAKGDPKMGKPQGKGVPARGTSDANFAPGGENPKMDQPGKGLQKKGLGDAGLPDGNEDAPDAGKPGTGGAEMGRPEGKGVAESVGNPEKVKPGTGKQFKGGGWLQSLDDKLSTELKSGDQGDKLSSVSPKVKGGVTRGKKTVAEGEVPEAFKKNWKNKGDSDDSDDECDTPGEKKRSGGEGKGNAKGQGKGPIGNPTNEDIAEILHPYIEGKDLNAKTLANAILKLKEAAKDDGSLVDKVQLIESYYVAKTTYEDVLELLKPFLGEEATFEAIDEAIQKLKNAAASDESLKESVALIDNLDLDEFKAVLEAQYKYASKGIKPQGYKKSALAEGEKGGDLSEDVAVLLSSDACIDDVIDTVVQAMKSMGGGEEEAVLPFGDEAAEEDEVEGALVEPADEEAEEVEEEAEEAIDEL